MAKYKHIIAATDLHFEDLPILQSAMELAEQHDAALSILSIVPSVPYHMASAGLGSLSDMESEMEAAVAQRVQEAKKKLNCTHDFHTRGGQAKHAIVPFAEEMQADLIVIGSHSRHGLQSALLGSTASNVLHKAACDVLVVRVKSHTI